jgi:asparagine N-glycosylation enzyme membrane subunit Stt3
MALALKLGRAGVVYYVVPLLGALAVWLTYVLGRASTGR